MKTEKNIDVDDVISEMETFIFQTENTIKSARRIMNGLRPEQLELLGIIDATEVYLHDFEESHHIKCLFSNKINAQNIEPEQALVIFRILQESLNNVLKHAMATLINVKQSKNAENIILEIVDNGFGFDINNNGRPDSYGIISMKEQIRQINGHFCINSKLGEGTTVSVEIPILTSSIINYATT